MNKSECRTMLKHQLGIEHRLKQAGLFTAAIAAHNKALAILLIYRRRIREQPLDLH